METTGNWFAIAAILAWPAVALYLYSSKNFIEASLWTILGALLFLPAGGSLKLAMIPALDKNTVPNLCLVMGSIFFGLRRQSRPGFGIASLLITGYIFSPLVTSLLNGDDINLWKWCGARSWAIRRYLSGSLSSPFFSAVPDWTVFY